MDEPTQENKALHMRALRKRIDAITPEDWLRVSMATDSDLNESDVRYLLDRIKRMEYYLIEIWDVAHTAFYAASGNDDVQSLLQAIAQSSAKARED